MKTQTTTALRLAIRVEGKFWNAYLAHCDTMANAVLLGSIRLDAVDDNPDLRVRFMDLMKEVLSLGLRDITGLTMSWPNPPQPAPERERGGNS